MEMASQVVRGRDSVSGKVTGHHQDRLAVVYVRQSTLRQVAHNTESARLQYALVERAAALGWAPSRVMVIDEDTGRSASGVQERTGFTRLVSEVGLGRVGVVLGIEMSRLARSGRDWHQLLELCALSRTLLADPDGVYDPGDHNDRLLLGLKGTISEAELYLIKQRMWGGRIAKARRGELGVVPPVGYLRRTSGEIVIDPDEQVQAVIRLVFAKFTELGTLHALLGWLVAQGIQIGGRQRVGPDRGELVWRRPNRTIVRNVIRSPIYAGIYAYGRRHTEPTVGGRRERQVKDPADWLVYLPDRLPAYISIEQWQRNLAQLEANRATATTPGAPRSGAALLSGLLTCGRCGRRRMGVSYRPRRAEQGEDAVHGHVYWCNWEQAHYGGGICQQLAGACLDEHITALVLDAIAPASLELSLHAAEQVEHDRAAVEAIWRQRLERADYAVDRARRAHHLAEPENRLVVRTLEAEWEQALADRETLQADHVRFQAASPRILTGPEPDMIGAQLLPAGQSLFPFGLQRPHDQSVLRFGEVMRAPGPVHRVVGPLQSLPPDLLDRSRSCSTCSAAYRDSSRLAGAIVSRTRVTTCSSRQGTGQLLTDPAAVVRLFPVAPVDVPAHRLLALLGLAEPVDALPSDAVRSARRSNKPASRAVPDRGAPGVVAVARLASSCARLRCHCSMLM